MKIEPTYVTFEQAKSIKERGFNVPVRGLYDPINPQMPVTETSELRNWSDFGGLSAPEQYLVVEWLRINHGIWIVVNFANRNQFYFDIKKIGLTSSKEYIYKSDYLYSTPQEAYSAAFDYILKELI
jgi:hypothetical protein